MQPWTAPGTKCLRLKKLWATAVLLCLASISVWWHYDLTTDRPQFPEVRKVPDSNGNESAAHRKRNIKVILLWSPFFSRDDYGFGVGRRPFVDGGCATDTCETTTDRRRLASSDAVLFHLSNIVPGDMPGMRPARQRWVFFTMESPDNTVLAHSRRAVSSLRPYDGQFNWTMTYRLDSDVAIPYFRMRPRSAASSPPPPGPLPRAKRRLVAWLVSHCRTPSKREQYVAELKKHVQVDVYGACGEPCPADSPYLCKRSVFDTHKFYLAFENSICADYVTEKLSDALSYGVVPVVYGGADYERVAPPGSYIDVRNFSSPRRLAEHLRKLDGDDALYDAHFAWKSRYEVRDGDRVKEAFCDLCARLHSEESPAKVYYDLHAWWIGGGNCSRDPLGFPQLRDTYRRAKFELLNGFLKGF